MLSRDDVAKVALLGRLRLSEQELATMTEQMQRIVGYVEQLNELNTDNVQPMAHPLDIHNVFADDLPGEHLSREAALANAPKRDDECYRVPAVLGE
jgi:aspartyl-tRNA(Asn)/glutamyl-tRNA(Gln) amidotransferase subunit C